MKTPVQEILDAYYTYSPDEFDEWMKGNREKIMNKEKRLIDNLLLDGWEMGYEGRYIDTEEYYNENFK
jgi:hypothetical protein